MEIQQEIEKIQKQVAEAHRNEATIEGRLQESFKRLKDELGLTTVEEAEKELENLKKKREKLVATAETKMAELRENYAWE